jgi:predicted  nucleic acid-binding Zn-ribbon protein
MPSPTIETLLILQDRDTKRLGIEAQLKAVPREIGAVEAKIAGEKAAIEAARTEIKELETKKKLLETEIGSAETKLAKYKTQQLSVRKNEEYQALGHEIETTQKQIGDFEGQELELMYGLDEAKKKFAAAEAVLKANISGHEGRIKTLREREVSLATELKVAQAAVLTAREPVAEPARRVYDRIAVRTQPVIVSTHSGNCSGCHLKISSEVETAARGKGPAGPNQLATCENCGRIVYWES